MRGKVLPLLGGEGGPGGVGWGGFQPRKPRPLFLLRMNVPLPGGGGFPKLSPLSAPLRDAKTATHSAILTAGANMGYASAPARRRPRRHDSSPS